MMTEPLITELDLLKARITVLEDAVKALQGQSTPKGTQGTMTPLEARLSGWVTPVGDYANVRNKPNLKTSAVVYKLLTGQTKRARPVSVIDIEDLSTPTESWYQLEDENFVREDVVTFSVEKPAARPLIPALPVLIPAMPVKWNSPVSNYTITNHHHNHINHDGVDYACPLGTPVRCGPYGGVVTKSFTCYACNSHGDGIASLTDKNKAYGFGSYVIVAYRYGQLPAPVQALLPIGAWLFALHAHLSRVLVQQGETLTPSQVIGEVGSTGNSSGSHLHYALHWGDANSDFYAIRKNTIDPQLLVMV
jgi:murein DD-endopeptidase MepM/ murein hydrolase activator NlpD